MADRGGKAEEEEGKAQRGSEQEPIVVAVVVVELVVVDKVLLPLSLLLEGSSGDATVVPTGDV